MADMESHDDFDEVENTEVLAAKAFVRRQEGNWTARDRAEFDQWMADPKCADAYRAVRNLWAMADRYADSPEMLQLRSDAERRTRTQSVSPWYRSRTGIRGAWAATLVGAVAIGLAAAALLRDTGESVYETGIGEQRVVELEDHSRIALDAATKIVVRMSRDSRVLQLTGGQAQFMVASDPRRPFRVEAGVHSITAVGTSFNVEYLDQSMRIAMVEGKVAISVGKPESDNEGGSRWASRSGGTRDLVAGQELRVAADGQVQFIPNADVGAAVMWRQGKLIFKDAPLSEAVRRINRYSRMQIIVEGSAIQSFRISGIFDAGDTMAFIEAIQAYLPISAMQDGPERMRLQPIKAD